MSDTKRRDEIALLKWFHWRRNIIPATTDAYPFTNTAQSGHSTEAATNIDIPAVNHDDTDTAQRSVSSPSSSSTPCDTRSSTSQALRRQHSSRQQNSTCRAQHAWHGNDNNANINGSDSVSPRLYPAGAVMHSAVSRQCKIRRRRAYSASHQR